MAQIRHKLQICCKKRATVARNPLELLVAGTGFEPVTFGL
jgi:hypothetical protein